jgi:hypothetical protein
MNPNLESVQIALDNVSKIAERRQGLEAEQQELQTKIQTLTATVAGGDAKSVNALNIAKARAEVLPDDLSSLSLEFSGAITTLSNSLLPISPMVAKAHGKEFRRIEATVQAFLETLITDGYLIEKFALEITNNAKTVRALEFLNARFSSLQINKLVDAKSVISRAEDAIARLEHVE